MLNTEAKTNNFQIFQAKSQKKNSNETTEDGPANWHLLFSDRISSNCNTTINNKLKEIEDIVF